MSVPSSAATFALILLLVFLVDSDGGRKSSAASPGSAPEPVVSQPNPYLPRTAHDRHPVGDSVINERMWHAFALLGTETFFASHLTNLFMEVHKYQLIIEISLPEPYRSKLIEERKRHPADGYFVANLFPDDLIGSGSDPMNLSELAAGLRTSFKGNVWRGIPNKSVYNDWPWRGVRPFLSNVPISIKRIVHFVPFSESMNHPDRLSYLLFGSGAEAHLVHLQTMHSREPDFDHVASLKEVPGWLATDSWLLEAGAVVDLPDKPRFGDDEDKRRGVRCATPFEDGAEIDVRYRGADPSRRITIGTNKWFCTRIANSPDPCKEVNERKCGSETPEEP
jgi:hypothetical protein